MIDLQTLIETVNIICLQFKAAFPSGEVTKTGVRTNAAQIIFRNIRHLPNTTNDIEIDIRIIIFCRI